MEKKIYKKPKLYMERFQLTERIAGCNITMNYTVDAGCTGSGSFTDGFGETKSEHFFVNGVTNCELKVDKYCYTNGAGTISSFNS